MQATAVPLLDQSAAPPARPLGPAREALARALRAKEAAGAAVERAREPVAALEKIRAEAVTGEAGALEVEVQRLRQVHAADIDTWLSAGAVAGLPRPPVPDELIEAEHRLAYINAA